MASTLNGIQGNAEQFGACLTRGQPSRRIMPMFSMEKHLRRSWLWIKCLECIVPTTPIRGKTSLD